MQRTYEIPADKVAMVDQFVAAVAGSSVGVPPSRPLWIGPPGYPKLEVFKGSTYMLRAPLNANWKPAATDFTFGGMTGNGVRYLADPSNSDAYHNPRSPADYPLQYGLEPVPGTTTNERQVVERMPPRVNFDGVTHTNDAEVEAYRIRTQDAGTQATIDASNAADAALNDTLQPGQFDIRTANTDDVLFYWYNAQLLQQKVGPRNVVKSMMTWLDTGSTDSFPEVPGLEKKAQMFVRGVWDQTPYQGPLRGLL